MFSSLASLRKAHDLTQVVETGYRLVSAAKGTQISHCTVLPQKRVISTTRGAWKNARTASRKAHHLPCIIDGNGESEGVATESTQVCDGIVESHVCVAS